MTNKETIIYIKILDTKLGKEIIDGFSNKNIDQDQLHNKKLEAIEKFKEEIKDSRDEYIGELGKLLGSKFFIKDDKVSLMIRYDK